MHRIKGVVIHVKVRYNKHEETIYEINLFGYGGSGLAFAKSR